MGKLLAAPATLAGAPALRRSARTYWGRVAKRLPNCHKALNEADHFPDCPEKTRTYIGLHLNNAHRLRLGMGDIPH